MNRTASTSSNSSIRSAWIHRKQSLAIEQVDKPLTSGQTTDQHNQPITGHASKQFLSKFQIIIFKKIEILFILSLTIILSSNKEQINDFCDRDLLYRMTDTECELLWILREDCQRQLPNALNKLLLSFRWNNQKKVATALCLLNKWPKIQPDKALELLDYAYPDSMVRKYAIECIKGLLYKERVQKVFVEI